MNKQELEKMFNEKVTSTRIYDEYRNEITDEVFNFIFETIIHNVLDSMLIYEWSWNAPIIEKRKFYNKIIKQKAKELYWIIL